MSLIFAVVLLGIQNGEFWMESWLPDDGPAPISLRLPAFSVFRVHLGQPAELVRRQVIIGRGDILEDNEDARLAAAYEEVRRDSQVGWSLGMFLVSFVAALLLLAELRRSPGNNRLLRSQVTLIVLLLFFAAGAKAFLLFTSLPAYYYPMPAIVILTAFVMGRRVGLAMNLFASTIFASLLGFDLSALVVIFTMSYAATLFLSRRKKRRTMVIAGSLSGWFGALALLVMMLVFAGSISIDPDLLRPDYSNVLAAVVNGVFSGIVAFLLIEPIGWFTGRVSPAKLVDLQDLDNPIFKQIRAEAPGTWEHSRAAANLAEAAAAAIGADSLLVRVGAYVHDAGKALNPAYFIENQTALAISNPHDDLEPQVSADCIFDHVREGTDLLRKHRVPEAVVEFAYTHHGTSLLEYFWVKNMQTGNPKGLRERSFRYPGMRPRTRETGILMIVDAVEAASRTIKEPAKHKYENLVQRIVFTKLHQGQLDDCGLTLADLKAVTNTLVDSLVNMYHARIEYPWQRTNPPTQTGQMAITGTGPRPGLPQDGRAADDTGVRVTSQGASEESGTQAITESGQHTRPSQAPPMPKPTPPPETPVAEVVPIASAPREPAPTPAPGAVVAATNESGPKAAENTPSPRTRKKPITLSGLAPVAEEIPPEGQDRPKKHKTTEAGLGDVEPPRGDQTGPVSPAEGNDPKTKVGS